MHGLRLATYSRTVRGGGVGYPRSKLVCTLRLGCATSCVVLCRYLLRPPLALERLTESSHGQLVFELAHPRADGTPHLLREPLELIEKLAVLVPPPRFPTLRFPGVLGPHAALRSGVIPRCHAAGDEGTTAAGPSEGTGPRAEPSPGSCGSQSESSSWAALLRRVFALDVFHVPALRRPAADRRRAHRGREPACLCASGSGATARRHPRRRRARRRERRSNRTRPSPSASLGPTAPALSPSSAPACVRALAAPGFFSTRAGLPTARHRPERRRGASLLLRA